MTIVFFNLTRNISAEADYQTTARMIRTRGLLPQICFQDVPPSTAQTRNILVVETHFTADICISGIFGYLELPAAQGQFAARTNRCYCFFYNKQLACIKDLLITLSWDVVPLTAALYHFTAFTCGSFWEPLRSFFPLAVMLQRAGDHVTRMRLNNSSTIDVIQLVDFYLSWTFLSWIFCVLAATVHFTTTLKLNHLPSVWWQVAVRPILTSLKPLLRIRFFFFFFFFSFIEFMTYDCLSAWGNHNWTWAVMSMFILNTLPLNSHKLSNSL